MTIKICSFAILCVVVAALIKHLRPDFLPYVRIGTMLATFALAVSVIGLIVTYVNSLFDDARLGEFGGSILKALGVALLVQICADICRDCGENSAASGVELVGKLEIIILCLPMIKSIISIALEVLQW